MKVGYKNAEVIVVGGGVAGSAAAISSSRLGIDTLLIERYGFPGGMFTGGNMTVLNSPPCGGISKEIVDELTKRGYARRCPDDPPNYPVFHCASEYSTMNVLYDAEMAKVLLFEKIEEAGTKMMLHTFAIGSVVRDGAVKGVIVANKSGIQVIEGKVIVDATSDGDIAAFCGVSFRKGEKLFPMTLMVRLGHVNWSKVSEYSRKDPGWDEAISKASKNGELPYYKPRTREMANYWGHPKPELSHLLYDDEALLWGGTIEGVDGTNVDDLTRAEKEARKQFMSELNFLKKYIPGFEEVRIIATGVNIGVRDTRHIIGEYTLTGEDILFRRSFPEKVVAYNMKGGFPANDIPYGCLLPKEIDSFLVVGNCISVIPGSTQQGERLGSFNDLKDIPTMWTIGEAGGAAAALSVKTGIPPRQLSVELLQEELYSRGALIDMSKVKELEEAMLPSGKKIGDLYRSLLSERIEYWRNKGELEN